ncbi:30S ribosomal protein S21 [Calothrix sp. 336/3]|uniref:30S ribosomal protein S21 n=1 Tax=Calothrix sp. 336/3 TaxID=1337936 RepID=UPI00054F81C1|nr:30S ribosomal protein S21 [Calothrix sp. 336/3]AKG23155.1 30S ribosomal protein S21 [Calothrix sp. 336/3]
MAEVRLGENESIDSALRRFKKKIQKAGILSEVKRRERYEKPSLRRKRKAADVGRSDRYLRLTN